ncbi:MAG: DUF805 domain-containing protein [Prevotella sp.]|nr:DUF805 domain-containing protein [Prevotella sp.]
MERYIATPQLGFKEAVKLAWSRLFDFKGRSRRSEFWWFMLAFYIGYYIVNVIVSSLLPYLPATIVNMVVFSIAIGVTVRRLQDNGHSKWWVILSYILIVALNIYIAQSDVIFELTSVNPNIDNIVGELSSPSISLLSFANMVLSLVIFVFCLIDGKPDANQYGESPKYKRDIVNG